MHEHHHYRRMRMRRSLALGPRSRMRGFRMMGGFMDANPDCADKMLRYGVAQMREEGFSEEEIRDHLDALSECGHVSDADIDTVLG